MDKTEHKATDIREIKTIEAVYGAFLTLIEHLSFAEITVKAICEEARISRSTFYDHFEDKYHLLRSLMQTLSEDVARDFVYFESSSPAALPMLGLSDRYRKLYQEIFFNPDNAIMRDIYLDVISSDIVEKICQYQGLSAQEREISFPKLRAAGDFYAGGILSVMRLWCSGKSALSTNEMADCIRVLLSDLHSQGSSILRVPSSPK